MCFTREFLGAALSIYLKKVNNIRLELLRFFNRNILSPPNIRQPSSCVIGFGKSSNGVSHPRVMFDWWRFNVVFPNKFRKRSLHDTTITVYSSHEKGNPKLKAVVCRRLNWISLYLLISFFFVHQTRLNHQVPELLVACFMCNRFENLSRILSHSVLSRVPLSLFNEPIATHFSME